MIFIAIILLLIILFIIYNSKTVQERRKNIKRILFIFLGIISFLILIRISPFIIALLTSIVVVIIPFISNILNFFTFFTSIKGIFKKQYKTKHNNSTMSKSEAYDILGVNNSSSIEEIQQAYKQKMKKNHPDLGGSEYLTKLLTEARDILINGKKG